MQALRDSLSSERRRSLSRLVCRRLEGLLSFSGARHIGVYAPVKGEVDLSPLWGEGERAGRTFFFPRVEGRGMSFRAVRDPGRDLRPGKGGIPEPSSAAEEIAAERLEAVLTPGLAFDRFGQRIGTGAGYYDRFFGALGGRPLMVGVGFDFQLVREGALPADGWDGVLGWVATDREVLKCLPRTYVRGDGNEHDPVA